MFVHALDKKNTLLKILLNPGLNSAIFRGTRPSVKSKEINCAPKSRGGYSREFWIGVCREGS